MKCSKEEQSTLIKNIHDAIEWANYYEALGDDELATLQWRLAEHYGLELKRHEVNHVRRVKAIEDYKTVINKPSQLNSVNVKVFRLSPKDHPHLQFITTFDEFCLRHSLLSKNECYHKMHDEYNVEVIGNVSRETINRAVETYSYRTATKEYEETMSYIDTCIKYHIHVEDLEHVIEDSMIIDKYLAFSFSGDE